jgi:hypothetical protein
MMYGIVSAIPGAVGQGCHASRNKEGNDPMAIVSWKHAGSGTWTTASNWSSGAVPGSGDDVSILVAGAITVTVSSGNNLVDSLTTGANDGLALTGGTLDILGYGTLAGAVKQSNAVSASTLIVSGQGISITGNFTQSAGSVVVQAGKFILDGAANSLAGSVSGAGWLTLDNTGAASTTTLSVGAALSVAHVNVQYGTLSLAANISYAGNYIQTGSLLLNAKALTLNGVASIGGIVGTNGALDLNGSETLDGTTINGSTVINVAATTTLRGATLTLGGAAGATASIDVLAGATLRLADDYGITTASTASRIQVSGTLLKSGYAGESVISSQVFSYSTTVPVGTITVAEGTLGLQGTRVGIGGLVNGAGTLAFDGGATLATIYTGTTLNVGSVLQSAGSLAVNTSLSYAGAWVQTGGTLTVGKADVLTLTGTAQLQAGDVFGPGTLNATSALLGTGLAIDSGMHLNLSGNSVQTGYVYIGDLANAAPTVTVLAGASYTLLSGSNIEGGPGNGTFAVVGSLISQGPAANYDYANTTVTGTVTVASGILDLTGVASLGGSIGGAGILSAAGTTTIAAGATLSVGEIYVGGTLNVLGNESYAGTLVMGNSAVLSVATGATLTLSGPSDFNGYAEYITGGGVVAATGSVTVSGIAGYPTYLDGNTTLTVANVADQSGDLYIGISAGANAFVENLSAATWTDHGGNIYAGSGAGTFENTGTFSYDGAGAASITASLDNSNVVQILGGDLGISGTVIGGGSFEIGNGATLGVITSFDPTATVGFNGASGLLQVSGYGTVATALAGFATGNEIDLINFSFASAAALTLSGGVLTATDGTNIAQFTVGAGHSLANYAQQTDGAGGIAIFHT